MLLRRRWASSSARGGSDRLYRLLGLRHDALPAEVKAAYMMTAKRTHPDVCREPGAAERFREISHAYMILSDPQKRRLYDAGASDDEAMAGRRHSHHRTAQSPKHAYELWKRDILLHL